MWLGIDHAFAKEPWPVPNISCQLMTDLPPGIDNITAIRECFCETPDRVATSTGGILFRLASDDHLDPQALSLGDCGFPICFDCVSAFAAVLGFKLEWPDNLREYRSAIEAHAAVATGLAAYATGMERWLESKGV